MDRRLKERRDERAERQKEAPVSKKRPGLSGESVAFEP
jgi:hypothetical protein